MLIINPFLFSFPAMKNADTAAFDVSVPFLFPSRTIIKSLALSCVWHSFKYKLPLFESFLPLFWLRRIELSVSQGASFH